ncbi:ATP-grasp domain-containing protein [Mycobacterium parmense]|nr:ATP-grasp domain-containing protein [Mycobacterium parmense]MCV7350463.1 ATP-grasp domain-containing protein [Mycobacterium parmense]
MAISPATPAASADAGPRVMLVGSGELSRELAISLRRLGAKVIAVEERADGLAATVGRERPDYVCVTDAVSASDLDALDRLATGGGPDGPELVPSARALRLAADTEGLRRLAADELGLPTAPFWFAGSAGELEAVGAHVGYPLLVKSLTGHGISSVSSRAGIGAAWQRAVGGDAGAERARVLAEAVVEVEFHITLLAVRSDGPRGPVIEFCSPIGHRGVDADVLEAWQPQKLTAAAMDASRSIAARIVKALGGRGVFGVELMINGDEVYFAGVTALPRASAWTTLRGQRLSAFELLARTIMGLPVDTMMLSPSAVRGIEAAGSPSPAALRGALGVPESDVRATASGLLALATAPEVDVARDRAREVAGRLDVGDSRG